MSLWQVFGTIIMVVRSLVGIAFLLAAVIALTHWGVRSGKIAAFGRWATFVRGWSDPLLGPVERRLHRHGANPQQAPIWLLGGVVVLGLLTIAATEWILSFIAAIVVATQVGPRAIAPMLVNTVFQILIAALLVRVIASWFGVSPYGRIMRIAHGLTDWLVDPIRRVLPNMGMIDFSPLVAWLVLSLTRSLVMSAFF